jgi:glycosyltransferase involved in cell wall biosynthesis
VPKKCIFTQDITMISILIPTYNYNCFPLVETLLSQAEKLAITFEIIVADDASTDPSFLHLNRKITKLSNCELIELKQNKGRSNIRNYLAEKAEYQWLLFLDVDTQPKNPNFLERYLNAIDEAHDVIYGGIHYKKNKSPQNSLRYRFGIERECVPVLKRLKAPYEHFITIAFLVKKHVFSTLSFSDNLLRYGYEDVVFALQLKEHNIKIKHVDNPITHLNLETNSEFLNKYQLSIASLLNFYRNDEITAKDNRLLSIYESLKRMNLVGLGASSFKIFRKTLEKNLHSNNPSLRVFDIFKLGYLCTLAKKKDA